ncbi:hypothetical protein OYC64_007319 [Pagothenia borchgrevinki]|uniref:SGNH hydrolase-type esterase domain-containing protein n=1 Tax=Pagothenia borchgrevinki TaxID=8213 RepID=A0ABD2G435_PAGBO
MEKQVANAFNPCIPTVNTSHLLQENASNWLQTGLKISDEHHTKTISTLLFKLKNITKEEEQQAWEVTCRWARSKYPRIQDRIFISVAEDLNLMGIQISPHRPVMFETTTLTPHPENTTTQFPNGKRPSVGDAIVALASDILPTASLVPAAAMGPLLTTATHPEPETSHPRHPTQEDFNLPPTPIKSLATRHEHHGNKKKNWSLTPNREILIIGSSNISRLPPIQDMKIQVDSYPGANLIQRIHILKYKTPTTVNTKKVILCFGLNDRNQDNTALLKNNMNQLLSSARDTFPNATLHIPSINSSSQLPLRAIRNIANPNQIIEQTPGHITKLDGRDFTTGRDLIHWTSGTARKMWDHWRRSLNLRGLRHENI